MPSGCRERSELQRQPEYNHLWFDLPEVRIVIYKNHLELSSKTFTIKNTTISGLTCQRLESSSRNVISNLQFPIDHNLYNYEYNHIWLDLPEVRIIIWKKKIIQNRHPESLQSRNNHLWLDLPEVRIIIIHKRHLESPSRIITIKNTIISGLT